MSKNYVSCWFVGRRGFNKYMGLFDEPITITCIWGFLKCIAAVACDVYSRDIFFVSMADKWKSKIRHGCRRHRYPAKFHMTDLSWYTCAYLEK